MLNFLYLNNFKRLKLQIIFRFSFKSNYSKKSLNLKKIEYLNSTRSKQLKNIYINYVTSRSFCSSNVKLRAKTYVSIKDLTSNLQAESSEDAARRINTNPNPNRIACLVRRIYTIFIERDLDTKINNMNDLLRENF